MEVILLENVKGIGERGDKVKVAPGYAREQGIDSDHDALQRWRDEGKTLVFVLSDAQAVGAIALADIVRAESRAAIDKLKSMGLQCMMLTGDSESVARSVAAELELDDYDGHDTVEVVPSEPLPVAAPPALADESPIQLSLLDPIQIVRRYPRLDDREIVAFVAAGLAFGRVASVMASVEADSGPPPRIFRLIRSLGKALHS